MDDIELIEAAKRASTFQLLMRCARRIDERARERINAEAGAVVARPSTMALLPHIAFEGTRIVELADKLGITKQAVSKRVAELVAHGVVELTDDPQDRRAKLVRFTAHGLAAIQHGLGVLGALERELADQVGAERMDTLRETLVGLDAALGPA
jgi:DNA-binding MarR family transcriptional regulator